MLHERRPHVGHRGTSLLQNDLGVEQGLLLLFFARKAPHVDSWFKTPLRYEELLQSMFFVRNTINNQGSIILELAHIAYEQMKGGGSKSIQIRWLWDPFRAHPNQMVPKVLVDTQRPSHARADAASPQRICISTTSSVYMVTTWLLGQGTRCLRVRPCQTTKPLGSGNNSNPHDCRYQQVKALNCIHLLSYVGCNDHDLKAFGLEHASTHSFPR